MAEDRSSKTEQPTAYRLGKAREEGQVSRSMELNTVVVLLAAIFTLYFAGSGMYRRLAVNMTKTLSNLGQISIDGADGMGFLLGQLWEMAYIVAPVFIVLPIFGFAINLFQVGFNFTPKPLMPNLSKLDPIAGLGRLFTLRSLVELVKSTLKIVIVASVAYLIIRKEMSSVLPLGDLSPASIGYYVLAVAFDIFLKTCWALLILAILDFAYQKWQFTQDMKMTKEEVKEEGKQQEGDPLIKSRIRTAQREAAKKRMMSKVPHADVVVTNPTHFAVALKYDPLQAEAPVVVAKGMNLIAETIKQIAKENDVPITEDKPLARALYKQVEVGQVIPVLFYQAVADILSYVYRLKGKNVHGRRAQ